MRAILLALTACGFVSLWGVAPWIIMLVAFVVMFTNFATYCLLFERPNERARRRVAEQLLHLNPNTDAAQRLATMPVVATASDRRLGLGPMTGLNYATGICGVVLIAWGLVLRLF